MDKSCNPSHHSLLTLHFVINILLLIFMCMVSRLLFSLKAKC